MNKLSNYISKGRGIGAFLLLALAFVISMYFSITAKMVLTDSIPYIQTIADRMLPLKIENGQVTDPANTIREFDIPIDEEGKDHYLMVIDTTSDALDTSKLTSGIYLSRSYLYAVNAQTKEVRSLKLNGNFELPQKDYTLQMQSGIKWAVLLIAAVLTLGLFIGFLLLNLLFAFCAGLAAAITRKNVSFDTRMRLSSVLFCGVYLLSVLLSWAGIDLNRIAFFLIMLVLQIISLKKLPL